MYSHPLLWWQNFPALWWCKNVQHSWCRFRHLHIPPKREANLPTRGRYLHLASAAASSWRYLLRNSTRIPNQAWSVGDMVSLGGLRPDQYSNKTMPAPPPWRGCRQNIFLKNCCYWNLRKFFYYCTTCYVITATTNWGGVVMPESTLCYIVMWWNWYGRADIYCYVMFLLLQPCR